MRKWLGGVALSTVLALGLAAQPAAAARATITFADQTGVGATGTLILDDFVLDVAGSGTFVSWDYVHGPTVDHVDPSDLFLFESDLFFSFVGEEATNNVVTIRSLTTTFLTGVVNDDPLAGPALLWVYRECLGGGVCGGGDGPQIESSPPATYLWRLDSILEASPPDAGVPEPMTWTLMIAGLGLAGAQLRARRRRLV